MEEPFDLSKTRPAPLFAEKFDLSKARPAIPYPFEVPAEERIKQLEEYLNMKILRSQRSNIEHVIEMYKTGELKSLLGPPHGKGIHVCGGQIFDEFPNHKERKNLPVWFEGVDQQMMQQRVEGQQKIQPWSCYEQTIPGSMHKFHARIRLLPIDPDADNKNLPSIVVEISNDTGSSIQTVFTSDLAALGYDENTYHGKVGFESIMTAAGPITRPSIYVELMVLDSFGFRMTDWFQERAAVVDDANPSPGLERLSGTQIRRELYFATDRKNKLFTGVSKSEAFKYIK